jgi:hypothetical protein
MQNSQIWCAPFSLTGLPDDVRSTRLDVLQNGDGILVRPPTTAESRPKFVRKPDRTKIIEILHSAFMYWPGKVGGHPLNCIRPAYLCPFH